MPPLLPYDAVVSLARAQHDVVTVCQARALGMSDAAIRHRTGCHGWRSPIRGTVIVPPARDAARSRARAAVLVAGGVVCGMSAARLHGLGGLPPRRPREPCDVAVTGRPSAYQRRDIRRHWVDVDPADVDDRDGLPVTGLLRTLEDLVLTMDRDTVICVLDSALNKGQVTPEGVAELRERVARHPGGGRATSWALVDGRAESPLETRIRLVLVDAGLAPDELQWQVHHPTGGFPVARIDLAWPRRRLAVEADGAGPHGTADALHRDRHRQNDLVELGWQVLRFTWNDVAERPWYVVSQVRRMLAGHPPAIHSPGSSAAGL